MRSPGRPPVAGRAEQQRFWKAITRGLSSEDAAVSCGVSPPVGGRWFREGGGMPPISLAPRSARSLSFAEREEIAILRAQGAGVRDIARRLRRAPSTVSRELRRNAATRSGGLAYRASTAQWHSDRRAKRPKIAKLAANDRLRSYVQDHLAGTVMAEDGTPAPWSRQGVCGLRHHDQRAARRGQGPSGSWTLGRRPDHRTWQFRDRHIGRTHHPIHDAAPPASHGRPWPTQGQERSGSCGA